MFLKWCKRKDSTLFYLFLVFTCITSSVIILTIGLAEAAITGYYKEIYRFSLPLAYSLVVVANIFLFLFTNCIMEKGKKMLVPIIIISIIIIVALFLPWNWWGVPREVWKNKCNTRLYSTGSFVIFSFSLYIYIAILSLQTKKKTDEETACVGLSLLFWSMISLICFFVMILIDNMLIVLFNRPGYSEFIYIAWIFAILFIILSYLSLVMPNWLVNWIEKKDKDK
jgi:hypothetical protein